MLNATTVASTTGAPARLTVPWICKEAGGSATSPRLSGPLRAVKIRPISGSASGTQSGSISML